MNIVKPLVVLPLGVALLLSACATGPLLAPGFDGSAGEGARTPDFAYASDTFAFPNLIRARHPGVDDLYANYCFVLARGLRQFSQFARFDPGLPKLDHAGYRELVERVAAPPPPAPPPPPPPRRAVPGAPP